jgi:hypothetical protein
MRITKRQLRKLIKESIIVEQATDKQVKVAQDNIKIMVDAVGPGKLTQLLSVGGEDMKTAFLEQIKQAFDKLEAAG